MKTQDGLAADDPPATRERAISFDALRRGEEDAWRRFFLQFDALIRAITAWSKWRFEEHTREDVAQAIRSELPAAVRRLREEASLEAFVKRMCIHRCIDEIRREVRERQVFLPLATPDGEGDWKDADPADQRLDPVEEVIQSERSTVLRRLVAALEAPCDAMIRQFYVESLSYKDMAARHGIAINTVGSRLSRCLERLRALVAKDPAAADLAIA